MGLYTSLSLILLRAVVTAVGPGVTEMSTLPLCPETTILSNPCASGPCLNEGTCVAAGPTSYVCFCIPPYTGDDCEISPFSTTERPSTTTLACRTTLSPLEKTTQPTTVTTNAMLSSSVTSTMISSKILATSTETQTKTQSTTLIAHQMTSSAINKLYEADKSFFDEPGNIAGVSTAIVVAAVGVAVAAACLIKGGGTIKIGENEEKKDQN